MEVRSGSNNVGLGECKDIRKNGTQGVNILFLCCFLALAKLQPPLLLPLNEKQLNLASSLFIFSIKAHSLYRIDYPFLAGARLQP